MKSDEEYMFLAIQLAKKGMDANKGGPFGAIIVDHKGEIIGEGVNKVTSTNDPTAHAEIIAIRMACVHLESFQVEGCTIFTSCEPCPMCLGAIYWARPSRVVYACSREDAAKIGFDDDHIYQEIFLAIEDRKIPMVQTLKNEGIKIFDEWERKNDKLPY